MAVSANTLFHFTSINSLKGILLSKGFYCKYSDEHFENILPRRSTYRYTYIPMVSFCDLTITQLSNDSVHRKNFGEFGIGLTKEWGVKNKVSPVMYVHRSSRPTKQLHELIKMFKNLQKKLFDKSQKTGSNQPILEIAISEIESEMADSFKYIKPYKGRWHKGNPIEKREEPIIYYNEREWRYCPELSEFAILSASYSENKIIKEKLNQLLRKQLLTFSPEDIKFIIIKNKKNINEVTNVIRKMKKITAGQRNQLLTKIITFEEIKEDY